MASSNKLAISHRTEYCKEWKHYVLKLNYLSGFGYVNKYIALHLRVI